MTKKTYIYNLLISLLFFILLPQLIQAQTEIVNTEIQDTTFGVTMKIKSDQSKYQPFQPIYIRITISNDTPNDIMFNKRFAMTKRNDSGYKSEISFKINKPNRDEAILEFFSDVEPLTKADFIKIKSKAKYERILDVTRWYWKELVKPGIYTLKCVYYNDQTGYQEWTADGYELVVEYAWIGEIVSNTITFTIDEITRKSVDVLSSKLTDKNLYNWEERSKVAEILGELKSNWALDSLLSRLKSDENVVVRNKSIEAISKYGKSASKRLLKLLDDKEPMTKILAARTLCMIGEKKGLGVVRKELKNENAEIVREAMITMGYLDKELAIKDLKDFINDDRELIKFTAIEVLKSLGNKVVLNKNTNKYEISK